jgi:hypothetical protein
MKILSLILALAVNATAGTYTSDLLLYKPAVGDTNYVTPFATGMDTLDSAIPDKRVNKTATIHSTWTVRAPLTMTGPLTLSGSSLTVTGANGIQLKADVNSLVMENTAASSASEGSIIYMRSNDGSTNATGDRLGLVIFGGNANNALTNSAAIEVYADGAWGASDAPAKIIFKTAPDGSATRAERMAIAASGAVTVTGDAFSVGATTFTVSGGFTIHNVQNKATINAMNGVVGGVVTCSDCTRTYTLCVGTGTAKGAFREVGLATNCN